MICIFLPVIDHKDKAYLESRCSWRSAFIQLSLDVAHLRFLPVAVLSDPGWDRWLDEAKQFPEQFLTRCLALNSNRSLLTFLSVAKKEIAYMRFVLYCLYEHIWSLSFSKRAAAHVFVRDYRRARCKIEWFLNKIKNLEQVWQTKWTPFLWSQPYCTRHKQIKIFY